MLRNCKVYVVVVGSTFCYNEITKLQEDFIMNLPDKIIKHRKANGWSQEDFAEKLNVSRQAISRWENGTALPDAQNVLQISKLFNVTTDYLLNDDYESDKDIPLVRMANQETEDIRIKKKKFHLISAIAFTIATCFWVIGVVNSVNYGQLCFFCFGLGFCGVNAGLQFGYYFRKR